MISYSAGQCIACVYIMVCESIFPYCKEMSLTLEIMMDLLPETDQYNKDILVISDHL